MLSNQAYFIGIHQDSNQSKVSLPLIRFLGIIKLKIAQLNTSIGVVKNSMKLSSIASLDPEKKLDKIVSIFVD